MARVNVDQVALTDSRFARLAHLRGWADADHARGKMLLVWNECIHRGSVLEAWVIDHHLGAGAAGDLLECRLADLVGLAGASAGDPAGRPAGGTLMRIKGTAGRTDYLDDKIKAAKLGGKARAAQAQRVAGRFASQANQPVAGDTTSAPAPSPAPVPPPAPDHSEKNSASPSGSGSRARKTKPSDPTAAECEAVRDVLSKLGSYNGVAYSGAKAHTRLIVARLRDGLTVEDLKVVAGYCALELGWQGNPKMEPYLCPETLYGPEKIAKYLDPSRAWIAKLEANEPAPVRTAHSIAEIEPDWMTRMDQEAS